MRTLDDLVAQSEITDVLHRYCRGVDRMDAPLTRTCWHADGTAHYGPLYHGDADGLIAWMWPIHTTMATHSHQVTNKTIVVSGDHARAETYVSVTLRTAGDEPVDILGRGRYLDTLSRRDGVWAIDHRVYVDDFTGYYTSLPVDLAAGVATAEGDVDVSARRDLGDPSYAHLAG